MTREGPVVYLLHGLLETSYGHFRHQIDAWRRDHRLFPVDLPGHGRCPVDAGAPYVAQMCAYVIALMERTGPGRMVAASYLGGPVGLRCAAQRPDLVSSLVLTGFVPAVPRDVFGGWVQSVVKVSGESPELAAAYDEVHGGRWRRTLATFVEEVEQRYAEGLGVDPSHVGRVELPVLIANGSAKCSERTAAARAGELGPHVRGSVIDEAGHIPGRDRPAAFESVVERFWSEVDASIVSAR